jgi:hypothetical protein
MKKQANEVTKMKLKLLLGLLLAVALLPFAQGKIELDGINFDPAIIASGDEVDIVIQFHADAYSENEIGINDPDYRFVVRIKPDDTLTQDYVTIQDAEGDNVQGWLVSGNTYAKKFRVKVNNDAPAGNYEFLLEGQWVKGDEPQSGTQFVRFTMPVKKEGIILDITTLETVPAEVRPGDNFVKIVGFIENVGEKDAKSVEINLDLPEGLTSSYANDNRLWVGRVNAGESKEVTFFLDVDESASTGTQTIKYRFTYMDLDNNPSDRSRDIPFLIKPRPYLEVVSSEGEGLAGETVKLSVKIKNTGTESAEAVDVRILKHNAQPFEIDVRSDYIGELEPGEEGVAIFDIKVNGDAEIKTHDLKLLIRSKGDSDEGDDNIYTYSRRAKVDVTGAAQNDFILFGGIGAGLVLVLIIIGWRKSR